MRHAREHNILKLQQLVENDIISVVVSGTTQINIVQSAALVSNGEEYYFTATYFV